MPQLIKPAEVVNYGINRPTPLSARADTQQIAPNIVLSELRWVKPLLGADLYNDMIAEQYSGNSEPPTQPKFPTNAAYETLWEAYLWQFCARAALLESITTIGLQIGANGIFLNNTETSDNAGIGGIKYKSDDLRNGLETLKTTIEEYLCENIADFPLYDAKKCEDCGCENTDKTTKTARKFGVVLTQQMRKK